MGVRIAARTGQAMAATTAQTMRACHSHVHRILVVDQG